MATPKDLAYEKRGKLLVKNLQQRHFDAYYCANREEALAKALELIPEGASVGWGGAMSAQQIGLMDAVRAGNYLEIDRDQCKTPEEREQAAMACLSADVFLTGANALSMSGEMVNIDGMGNRVAAPLNQQRFLQPNNPCTVTGTCANCKSETCICNHIVVTRHCRPVGRIKFILVGEDLGL